MTWDKCPGHVGTPVWDNGTGQGGDYPLSVSGMSRTDRTADLVRLPDVGIAIATRANGTRRSLEHSPLTRVLCAKFPRRSSRSRIDCKGSCKPCSRSGTLDTKRRAA